MTTYEDDAKWRAEQEAARASRGEGRVTGYDWPNRLIEADLGGARQWMAWAGPAPWIGDRVRVIWTEGGPTAFAVYGSAMGTVVSVSTGIATVTGDDGQTYEYPTENGASLSAGHRVRLDHQGQMVLARYAAEPPSSTFIPPTAPPSTGTRSAEFRATDSGYWYSGTYRGQRLVVSDNNASAAYFGSQILDSTGGAPFKKLELRLVETYDNLPTVPSYVGYHGETSRGGSHPTLSGTFAIYDGGTIDIMSWASAFQSGTARGIGFQPGSGYREFNDYTTTSIYAEW